MLDYLPHVVDVALSSELGAMALELANVGVVFTALFKRTTE